MPRSFTGYPAVDQALAGFGAGMVSTMILHPLDLIKTRFQVDESLRSDRRPFIGGTVKAFQTIWRDETVWGLYRGLSANVAGATASWGFYFWWYSLFKNWMTTDETGRLSAFQHLIASAEAGAITAVMTNPFWVVKTRMCATSRHTPGAYRGLLDGLYQITMQEGLKGLYKGIVPALFGVSHGALQFMAYEEMKLWRMALRPGIEKDKLDNVEYLFMAATSKVFATVSTYPYQVIRARLQNQRHETKYAGVMDAIRKIYSVEGFVGFYKGLAPNVIRVLPGTCITFLVYENLSRAFKDYGSYDV